MLPVCLLLVQILLPCPYRRLDHNARLFMLPVSLLLKGSPIAPIFQLQQKQRPCNAGGNCLYAY
jgi:hypothetical protein